MPCGPAFRVPPGLFRQFHNGVLRSSRLEGGREGRYHVSKITLSLALDGTPLFYARRNMKNRSNTKLVVEPTSIEVSLATLAPISGGKSA